MLTDFTENTAHDLWVEARLFSLDVSRVDSGTLKLTVTRPAMLQICDGAIILLSKTPFTQSNFPQDGAGYRAGSLIWNAPGVSTIGTAQVIAFYSDALGLPFPVSVSPPSTELNANVFLDTSKLQFSLQVSGIDSGTIYYASVHAASKVLQYYPLGIQSYPLDTTTVIEQSTFTGSIPTFTSAPVAPTPGMVYFDSQLNFVQYWDATRLVWIPTRTDNILSGDYNPGLLGQAYMLGGSRLRIFNGTAWITADSTSLQFRTSIGWVALAAVLSVVKLSATPAIGDFAYDYTSQRAQYWDGTSWQIPTPACTLFNNSGVQVPAFTVPFTIEPEDLITPYVGLIFYNLKSRVLNAWNGTSWEQVNTDQQGISISDKVGIGSTGSYEARLRLTNILKAQLGWPAACIELSEEQFNVAIDNALDTYRQLSVGAYEQRFIIFALMPNQATYYLNSPTDQTNAVASIMKIHRLNEIGVQGGGPDNIWGQEFAQSFYNNAAGGGDLLSTHLVHAWSEEFTRIFAGDIPFTWNEARRELTLKRSIRQHEKVVLEVELERTEQELMQDRWCKQFIQNWALAETKEYLGMIRSKYSSGTPGPAGTITLNGDTLLAESRQDFAELKEALLNYEYQNSEHGLLGVLIG